mgnify:FL=1|jgi:hypothetical protein|tara:strand:- start:410 stop:1141 length:732 start_codon:yes stop_codon:yes gene_type:complete
MKEILEKLRDDEHYYGKFGQQFLSNSDISTLLKNPKDLHKPKPSSPAFLVGGYFHTAILEPDKLKSFKIVEASTRNTKVYKEISDGELCLLKHEVDQIELMTQAVIDNDVCRDLIKPILGQVEYEEPRVGKIHDQMWKGKADIINHEDKLVIDLKTTSDIDKFQWSASKYNYDSQAYIYSTLFGYEMLFMVIDKTTHQIGLFDCSPDFYKRGEDKVRKACDAYELFYKTENFDHKQHLLTKTL